MSRYAYAPLDPSASTTRLMNLLPGLFDDDINISLETLDLANNDHQQYEALSYAWGSKDNPLEIYITDPSTNIKAILPVTQNLALALRYLRLPHLSRTLWIDAICIDQQNLEERGHQVKKMGDIYHTTRQVIIWLGPATDDSAFAIRILRGMSATIEVDWQTLTMRPTTPADGNWANPQIPLMCDNKTSNSFYNLLQAPWFNRLWIWQEVLLSRTAEIHIGYETLAWNNFRKAIFCLARKMILDSTLKRVRGDLARLVANVHRLVARKPFDAGLISYIEATIRCQFSDPRDRIYALLGIISRGDCVLDLKPVYTQPASSVFQDIVLLYLRRQSSLDILACCELCANKPQSPSWVPDWSNRRVHQLILLTGNPGNRSVAKADYISAGLLRATGVSAAAISDTQPGIPAADIQDVPISMDIHQMIHMFSKLINTHQPYIDGSDIIDAFCRTLVGDIFAQPQFTADTTLPSLDKSLAYVSNICRNFGEHSGSCENYLEKVFVFTQGRCFVTTQEGYVGLAPLASKAGDQICIILGCRSPLVLRPTTKRTYTVVGECYIHGLMQDEALLGPLPYKPDSTESPGDLPRGWMIRDPGAETGPNNWYVHSATGEETKYPIDPRMTVESIEARGVELREFVLE